LKLKSRLHVHVCAVIWALSVNESNIAVAELPPLENCTNTKVGTAGGTSDGAIVTTRAVPENSLALGPETANTK